MPKPVCALVGSDSFLQLQRLADILRELGPGSQRTDIDGERGELADALDELRSFAMFGGAKIVVVRNADAFVSRFREALEDYIAAPSEAATTNWRSFRSPRWAAKFRQRMSRPASASSASRRCGT